MKKMILARMGAVVFVAACLSAQAQGYVAFRNTPLSLITNALTGQPIFGTNTFRFGFYFGPPGSAPSQLTLLVLATNVPSASATDPLAGGFRSIPAEVQVTGGDEFHPVEVQIRGWSLSAGQSYEEAYAAARPNDPSVLLGSSEVLLVWPEVGPGPPVELFRPFGPLDRFTVGLIPEPSAFVLGGFGAAALLLFRRLSCPRQRCVSRRFR